MARRSVVLGGVIAVAVAAIATTAVVIGQRSAPAADGATVVTVNLWDESVATAYETSFVAFEAENPDIDVQVQVTPWASYFDDLLVDVGGKTASDIFWLNSAFTTYADNGSLVDVTKALGPDAAKAWEPSVVQQYTRNGALWGVPQLADGGKAVIYNKKLVAAAGLTDADLRELVWDPDGAEDTLLPVLRKLTLDAAGRSADEPGFDPAKIKQFGYNAAYDGDGILFNYVGSNGGDWRNESGYTFAEAESAAAIGYVVDLINRHHVAPSAADTNENSDFSKEQFLQGRLALFQTGLFNMAEITETADFEWGVVPIPSGPAGPRSVTNGIIAAGNAASPHPEQTQRVLTWLASGPGSTPIGAGGAAVPAVLDARPAYDDFWKAKDVDVAPFFEGETFTLPVLTSTKISESNAELEPIIKEVFLGRLEVDEGLRQAQTAANKVLGNS
ncbi:ABC transporter substrate-binding protein [Microlunatus sp. GCM10028923]|uniref:ABC transporter substrate-binding protein n=1 Tax=Microlunatus sp. GCM10028923 TaxID=3273400 RepID=UPI0036244BF2